MYYIMSVYSTVCR